MKVLVACQSATNKGDRAIAEYLISQLLESKHEVVLSTTHPKLWKNISDKISVIGMGYKSTYENINNRFIKKVFSAFNRLICDKMLFASLISPKGKHRLCRYVSKEFIASVKEADLVIVTGGHHITSIREKNALFQFTYDIGLVSLYAKRYVLWSQTIGPLEFSSNKAKNFIENIIKNAEKVFIRDENSLSCIKSVYGNFDNLVKTYDSVFGYGDIEVREVLEREKKVGISIFNGLKKAFKTYDVIAQMLDLFALDGYTIEFFRMEHDNYEQDNIKHIVSLMKQKADIKIYPFLSKTQDHLKEVASCRCFIGYKTHSIIMALTTATPLIAIAYHKKSADFMKDFGLEEYVVSDEELSVENSNRLVRKLNENLQEIQLKEKKVAQLMAKQLKSDLSRLINYD